MHPSQTSRLEADRQLSVEFSYGDPVPEQSSGLQAGVSSNVAALHVSKSVLSCGPQESVRSNDCCTLVADRVIT